MNDFKVIEEIPPPQINKKSIDWQARLSQIHYCNRWYLIGVWKNENSASNHKKKLTVMYGSQFSFRAVYSSETEEGKLYALKIEGKGDAN